MANNNKKKTSSLALMFRNMFGGGQKLSFLEEEQMQSPMKTVVKKFFTNKIAMVGTITFLTIFLTCFIVPIFNPLDLTFQDVTQQNIKPGLSMLNVPKELDGNMQQVSVGSSFSVGLSNDGKVYQWGILDDKMSQLPTEMGNVVQIAAGSTHAVAINDKGELFTWGYNRQGVGKIPREVEKEDIIQIAAGLQISFALSDEGELFWWGNDNLMSITTKEYDGRIKYIAPSGTTVMAILDDGSVVALEKNETPLSRVPAEMSGQKAVSIAATDKAAAAVTEDGTVYVWGDASNGVREVPEHVQGNAVSVTAGRSHFTALLKDGTVESWGRNNYKQAKAPNIDGIVEVQSGSYQNYGIKADGSVETWGLSGYLMGTDGWGRDVFARLTYGGRMTMTIGGIAVVISSIIGITVGAIAGYYGGKVDTFLMRCAEIVGSIPFLPFAMILSVIVGSAVPETARIAMIMVILGILSWMPLARIVRGQMLSEREKEFVTAAKATGVKEVGIIFRHILPNVLTVIIVNITLSFAASMLTESSLSFLGFGIIEPSPTWGNMLTGSQSSKIIAEYWWRWVFPGLALSLSTISINLIGDGLRDAIDPRANER